MKEIDCKEEFDEFINTRDKLVVIMFGAGWCGPCKIMSPFCEKMQTEKGGAVIFAKVDVDEAEDIAEECEIECMPTFVIFKEGEKVESMMGANKEQLASLIAKHL
ncbi:thioredoxin-like [Gigantopelta aegis]|uniref:thioredoxin-like n=1 Tax=Gigantopelta aegis TaxID=1735272 RepID=UPI001B88A944|nr:thioredoxin-like [Gigantopelta aegis]